jgi:hypothetical protein
MMAPRNFTWAPSTCEMISKLEISVLLLLIAFGRRRVDRFRAGATRGGG